MFSQIEGLYGIFCKTERQRSIGSPKKWSREKKWSRTAADKNKNTFVLFNQTRKRNLSRAAIVAEKEKEKES